MIEQHFWTTFFATAGALLATIVGGLIVQNFISRREKKKIIELLRRDCELVWQDIEWCTITPLNNQDTSREIYNFKGIEGLTLKGIPEYKFRISTTLKLFETEGTNIIKHLNRRQIADFWELYKLLSDLESVRQVLEKTEPNDVNYHSFQKMFVDLSTKSMKLYLKFYVDIQTWAITKLLNKNWQTSN